MKYLFILLILFNLSMIKSEDCDNWDNQYFCGEEGTFENEYSPNLDENAFQTPPRNDIYGRYRESFQDMHFLVGYARTEYLSDRNSAKVTFITKVNPTLGEKGTDYKIVYVFGQKESEINYIEINAEEHKYPNGMPISAKIIDLKTYKEIIKLELENKFFIWDNVAVELPEEYKNGQRGAIVELFGWPYEDITEECEFLGHAGYLGVKLYSPNEHLLSDEMTEGGQINPWWYGTQTVSFKLHSRFGDIYQLKKLINTCRSYNVRVYVEVVVNHMTGSGFDMYDRHRRKDGEVCNTWGARTGSSGSPFWGVGALYENNPVTGKKPVPEYSAVPYFPSDFHCRKEITDWDDPRNLTNGWLVSLADVNTEKLYPRQRIADFFTELIGLGISGISIANGRHIIPESFAAIFKILKQNLGGSLPEDLILVIILENIKMRMAMCNENSGLNFGVPFVAILEDEGFTEDEIKKIKIWFKGFAEGENNFPICDEEWKIEQSRHVISIEFSDDINKGNDYPIYIRDQNIEEHRQATISMFENEDYEEYSGKWEIIFIFSSFSLYEDIGGMLDGKSDCSYCSTEKCKTECTLSIPYRKAYKPTSKGYDPGDDSNWIEGEFSRVHRDKLIIEAMKKWLLSLEEMAELDEDQLYGDEIAKTNCGEKCLTCSEESKKNDLCLICNKDLGYFPVKDSDGEKEFYECYHKDKAYDRLYYDNIEMAFKPCYESCKTCKKGGTPEEHNCLSCDANLIQKPGTNSDDFNCVTNCANSYYFTSSGQYKCTDKAFCPTEASIYVEAKNKCIDNCQNDADYKYLYLGNCVVSCPDNTIQDTDNFICKDKSYNGSVEDCSLSVKITTIDDFHNSDFINSIVKTYRDEYLYTHRHILGYSKEGNEGYKLYIYKADECIKILALNILTIDPEECINKVKESSSINENLIIVYFESTQLGQAGYLLYNPISGHMLNFADLCSDLDIKSEGNFHYIPLQRQIDPNEPTSCPDGLYPIKYTGKPLSYNVCKERNEEVEKHFFSEVELCFLPCHEFCKTCIKLGDDENNNCNSCDSSYIKDPKAYTLNNFNCVQECIYSYYYVNGLYKCTSTPQCPLDYNKFIKEKNECVEDCKKDEVYRFLYNGICLRECPEGTKANIAEGDYLCREKNADECTISKKEAGLKNFYEDGGLDSLVKSYNDEFFYTQKHVSEFNNTNFKMLIYIDENCLSELNVKFPKVNFGDCYEKVQKEKGITDNLIIVLLERFGKNGGSFSSYSLYNPYTGQKIDAEQICKDKEIEIEENIKKKLEDHNINYESLTFLTNQNINIFNLSDAFYTDICFSFDSPNNRDITLKDRLATFYPNVSLCDEGCYSKGINLTAMKAICNCKFNDISNNELIDDIKYIGPVGEFFEIITSSNLQVFKCFKYIFKKFKTSIGGYLIVFSLSAVIAFGLVFYLRDLNIIKKYIAIKTTNYLNYLSDASASPEDKKDEKKDDDLSKNKILEEIKNDSIGKIKNANKQNGIDKGKELLSINKINNSKDVLSHSFKEQNSKNEMIDINCKKAEVKNKKEEENNKNKKEDDIFEEKENFKEYLEPDIDDQEFEDIVLNDKRSFQEYFLDSLAEKQIFVNTFFLEDPFIPLSIKIILLILNLILYMVVNGLFYGEDAISEIYHIEGDDPFFGFFPRSLTRFIYSAIVGVVIGFIIDCFFIEERRMKRIFIRQKENIVNLKFEIAKLNKKIKNRYLGFIIFTVAILILFFFYLLCFNYVYPHTQYEWIKSSITLIIIMQILSILTALVETILRFIGLMFKSERIFRVSKLLD